MMVGISSLVLLVVFLYLSFFYSIIQLWLFDGAWSLRLVAFFLNINQILQDFVLPLFCIVLKFVVLVPVFRLQLALTIFSY